MKLTTLVLSTIIALGSIQAQAFEFQTVSVEGNRMAAVPLPPRRLQGGSVYAIVSQAAANHGVPQRLAHAVIGVESRHNCHTRNRSGAAGLGQLMPGTARAMGVRNPMDCTQNANGAMKYLSAMLRLAGGDWCRAATAYNRGSLAGCSAYGRSVLRRAS